MSACAPSKPSSSEAEAALKTDVAKKGAGCVSVTSFEKTNGQDLNVFGHVGYSVEYKATLTTVDNAPIDRGTAYIIRLPAPSDAPALKKGVSYEITGTVIFEKKEKGWSLSEVNARRSANTAVDAALKPPPAKSF